MDDDAQRTQERLTLQEKSKARIANWPNTMHALRKKREEDRYTRLEAEEIERRRIVLLDAIHPTGRSSANKQDEDRAYESRCGRKPDATKP